MKDNIFREYDIRGKYPEDINEEIAYKIGLGYGSYLQEKLSQNACVVSHDNRLSSNGLYQNLIKGLLETGINVISYGFATTPMHYYFRHVNNLFGIQVTASHNPKDENGFKFSFDHYTNARGSMVNDLKEYINAGNFKKGIGELKEHSLTKEYINELITHLSLGGRKLKVIFDPANGVLSNYLEKIISNLNIDYVIINGESDGSFPAHHPDPSIEKNLDQLKAKVLETHADVGFSFDGDADRVGIIDNEGKLVSIENYSILLVRDIFNKVDNKSFLYDAKSSDTFKDEIERMGGTAVICRTGTSYTQEMVIRENLPYGFQYVGHISINDRLFSCESAVYAALRLIELLSKSNLSLSEMCKNLPKYFTSPEIKIPSPDNIKRSVIKNIKFFCDKNNYNYMEIDGLKIRFKDSWAYVRCSNTGPNITLRCEAKTEEELNILIDNFTKLVNIYNK